jgi:hypothetical protein
MYGCAALAMQMGQARLLRMLRIVHFCFFGHEQYGLRYILRIDTYNTSCSVRLNMRAGKIT